MGQGKSTLTLKIAFKVMVEKKSNSTERKKKKKKGNLM